MTDLFVPARFCGPRSSGNGGWTSGALAAVAGHPAVRVTLRRPPPLDTSMPVSVRDDVVEATADGEVVARAEPVDHQLTVVAPVPPDEAREAEARYPGLRSHPFPTCFSCGVDREEGDGLRIFPGQVADQDGATRVAATWTPHPSLACDDGAVTTLPVAWAALDCVGGWAGDLEERLMVLASMTAQVDALPAIGERHVVVGLARGSEGRRTSTASALFAGDGRLLACAEHVWVAVDPSRFS